MNDKSDNLRADHVEFVKRQAKETGVNEAEIVRLIFGAFTDWSWEKELEFARERGRLPVTHRRGRGWTREELYDGRV